MMKVLFTNGKVEMEGGSEADACTVFSTTIMGSLSRARKTCLRSGMPISKQNHLSFNYEFDPQEDL